MAGLTFNAGSSEEGRSDEKQWLRSDKRSILQLPVPRAAVRARLLDVFRSDVTDNKGWIFPRVKFSGRIVGDEITMTCTRYGRGSVKYQVTGHLLDDMGGGTQILLRIVEDLRLRILMTPFFALFPVVSGAYFLGLRGWLLAGAVALGSLIWGALGTATVYVVAMRQRDTTLEDVRRFLAQAVLQAPNADLSPYGAEFRSQKVPSA